MVARLVHRSCTHSTIQSWATALAPAARATGVAMFGSALYVGSALAGAFAAGPAEHHADREGFPTAAVLGVPLTVAAAVGRARYQNRPTRARRAPPTGWVFRGWCGCRLGGGAGNPVGEGS